MSQCEAYSNLESISSDEVLRQEAAAVHKAKLEGVTAEALCQRLYDLNSAALCLSGGGVRSAAFGLGVIQALAVHPRQIAKPVPSSAQSILSRFHFISTVSGGGYIGCWLTAWISRAGFWSVRDALAGKATQTNGEAQQISWLRSYSNYLTPRIGIASLDAWAGISLYIYNLVLSWLVIFPVVFVLVIAMKFFELLTTTEIDVARNTWVSVSLGVIGVASLIATVGFTARHRPSRQLQSTNAIAEEVGGRIFFRRNLLLSVISAVALVQYMQVTPNEYIWGFPAYCFGPVFGAMVYAVGWIVRWPKKHDTGDFLLWTISGVAFGVLLETGFRVYAVIIFMIEWYGSGKPPFAIDLVFGVPLLLLSQLVASILFLGLTSFRAQSDLDQEWLGRAGGVLLLTTLLWIAVTFLVFASGIVATSIFGYLGYWFASIGGISGLVTWIIGRYGLAPATGKPKDTLQFSAKAVLRIAAPIFAIAILILCSALIDRAMHSRGAQTSSASQPDQAPTSVPEGNQPDANVPGAAADVSSLLPTFLAALRLNGIPLGIAFMVALGVAIFASLSLNINRISLHSLYRNRLVRAFLGASNLARRPNLFTDFDASDNVPMCSLFGGAPLPDGGYSSEWRPFLIINITLNTASAKKLSWQERKAIPFTASPLHSGSPSKGYRLSSQYAGVRRQVI